MGWCSGLSIMEAVSTTLLKWDYVPHVPAIMHSPPWWPVLSNCRPKWSLLFFLKLSQNFLSHGWHITNTTLKYSWMYVGFQGHYLIFSLSRSHNLHVSARHLKHTHEQASWRGWESHSPHSTRLAVSSVSIWHWRLAWFQDLAVFSLCQKTKRLILICVKQCHSNKVDGLASNSEGQQVNVKFSSSTSFI